MKLGLRPIQENMTELSIGPNTILFSYQTPVAAFVSGKGYLITKQKYSQTTSRHISKWLASGSPDATKTNVDQGVIDALLVIGSEHE